MPFHPSYKEHNNEEKYIRKVFALEHIHGVNLVKSCNPSEGFDP